MKKCQRAEQKRKCDALEPETGGCVGGKVARTENNLVSFVYICHTGHKLVYLEKMVKICFLIQWKPDITEMVGPEQKACYSRSLLYPKLLRPTNTQCINDEG